MAAQLPPFTKNCTCGQPACGPPEKGLSSAAHHSEAAHPQQEAPAHTSMGAFKRWLLWFLTFFGIYASSSMCPFCGTPGCPVGAGSAALVGGFFAALWQYGRNIWESLKRMGARLKG